MTDLTLESLAERVNRVERQNRRLRIGVVVALLLIVAVAASAVSLVKARKPKALEAERFVLRDADGKMRADLGLTKEKRPALTLYDAKGTARVSLDLAEEGPSLVMHNAQGKKQVALTTTKHSNSLHISDGNGRRRISLLVGTPLGRRRMERYARIHLWDTSGHQRAHLSADEWASALSLNHPEKGWASLRVSEGQDPSLELMDVKGRPLFEAP